MGEIAIAMIVAGLAFWLLHSEIAKLRWSLRDAVIVRAGGAAGSVAVPACRWKMLRPAVWVDWGAL